MRLFNRTALGVSIFLSAHSALAEAGIPQMDPVWFPNQIFWLAISFAVLFVLVSTSIAPTVGGVLSARDEAIRAAIAEAEAVKQTAESTRGNLESASAAARAKAAEIMASAQAEASRDATAALAKLDHDLARKAEQAEIRIADAVLKAKSGLTAASQSLAEAMVEKLLGEHSGAAAPKRRAKA